MTGRWGGEEFIALIACKPSERIEAVAEDLRERLEMLGFSLPWPDEMQLTTSIGCAKLASRARLDAAIGEADRALYLAKQAGRNCWKVRRGFETALAALFGYAGLRMLTSAS